MEESFEFNEEMYSFEQASKRLEAFKAFLGKHDIQIEANSDLKRLALSIVDVLYKHDFPAHQDPNMDIRPWLRDVLGMNDLIHKILRVKDHPSISKVVAHLRLLNKGCPLQNVQTLVTDQASNKLFELLVCCALMVHSADVDIEDPDLAKGDNPDVIGTLLGRRWGFACKVAHALKGKTIFDSIEKGIHQIETSSAEVGVVIVNVKNIIKHDNYWKIINEQDWKSGAEPLFSGYKDHNVAANHLNNEISSIAALILKEIPITEFRKLFINKKAIPTMLFFVSTAIGTEISGKPMPASIGFLRAFDIAPISEDKYDALTLLNDGLQYRSRIKPLT